MKIKLFCIAIVLIFITSAFLVSATRISNKSDDKSINTAELPEWAIMNFWKYDMDFNFRVKDGSTVKFSINADIFDLYATVSEKTIIDGVEVYVLSLIGQLEGDLTLFQTELDIADISGPLTGQAYITKNELAIKKFDFHVDGVIDSIIGDLDLEFDMLMTFDPNFDFFDFPIHTKEDPWDVLIDEAYLYAKADIELFGTHDYESSMAFSDVISVNRTEVIGTEAGNFDTIVLSGTWGNPSQLWYAPAAGYLVKVREALNWDDGYIVSEFNLNLLDTNYDVSNSPPSKPDKPYGETEGVVEEDYTYSTQATDSDSDDIWYRFDWGNGIESEWIGPYASGEQITVNHRWYNKGNYNVMAQARDDSGVVSDWSDPLSVSIMGDPKVSVIMKKIEKLDEIDYDPIGDEELPEYYYKVAVEGEGINSLPVTYCNTDDGTYKQDIEDWNSENIWQLDDLEHEFVVKSNNPVISIQLMDFDDGILEGGDDLADISGCNVPDENGIDDFDETQNLRKAVYHGTYDLINKKLKDYSTGEPSENADYVYKQNGYFITRGDNQPDNSLGYENGIKDPENDASVWFRLDTDYMDPVAHLKVLNCAKLRPNEEVRFTGTASQGAPPYTWEWDFGDNQIEKEEQNPIHIYDSAGTYTVELTITDAFAQSSSYSLDIEVINYNPILSNDEVEWSGKGSTKDTFSFSIHYIDPDSDVPSVKRLYVDEEYWDLSGSGSNSVYSIELLGSDMGSGEHNYYFFFEDGHGGFAKSPEKTITVQKSRSRHFQLIEFMSRLINNQDLFAKILKFF